MHNKNMKRSEIDEAQAAGAKVIEYPRKVEGRLQMPELIEVLSTIANEQMKAAEKQTKVLIDSINKLTRELEKSGSKGVDFTKLVAAIGGLKLEAVAIHEPWDYEMTFERDENRHFIKSGVRFTAIPRTIN